MFWFNTKSQIEVKRCALAKSRSQKIGSKSVLFGERQSAHGDGPDHEELFHQGLPLHGVGNDTGGSSVVTMCIVVLDELRHENGRLGSEHRVSNNGR